MRLARRSPRAATTASLVLAVVAASCGGRDTPPPQLAPVAQLAIAGASEQRVKIGEESRLVVDALTAVPVALVWATTVPASGERTYPLRWPPEVRESPWVLLEAAVTPKEGGTGLQTGPMQVFGPDRPALPEELVVGFEGLEPGTAVAVGVHAHLVPDLQDRTVVSDEVVVPAGATLRFGYGVEPVAWRFESVAVDFVVDAIGGDEATRLFEARLDPAHVDADRRWHDAGVSLDALAGRAVRLRFSTRAVEGRAGTSLPAWVDPRVLAPRTDARRPGIVLISLDTVRDASTSPAWTGRDTTPTLTRMAADGVRFRTAVAPYPHTLPSHMSLFTGLYYPTHGVRGMFDRLGPEHPTLPHLLRDAGYVGASFTEDGFLLAGAGFQRGFSVYRENRSPNLHQPEGQGPEVFAAGLEWLARHADEPFFLFLHTYQAHWPYTPAEAYRRFFPTDEAALTPVERELLLYEQEIRHTDDLVRTVLDTLARLGLAETTLVIVTSDHGEEFDEHGKRFHGHHVHTESLGVPLVLRWPARIAAGTAIDFPVSLVDLLPTVLDLFGLAPLARTDGRSLVPWLLEPTRAAPDRAVFGQAPASVRSEGVEIVAAQTASRKCIRNALDDTVACYDLDADPREQAPLASHDDAATRTALARLEAFAAHGTPPPSDEPAAPLDPELEQKLQALGYLE